MRIFQMIGSDFKYLRQCVGNKWTFPVFFVDNIILLLEILYMTLENGSFRSFLDVVRYF